MHPKDNLLSDDYLLLVMRDKCENADKEKTYNKFSSTALIFSHSFSLK